MKTQSVLLGLTLAAVSSASQAVLTIDVPFVVSTTKTPQSLDKIIAPVIVITRQDIENSPSNDVAEILRFQAGLDIARSGGEGTQTSLFMRGTESDHVLVMIDGVKINPATLGQPAIQNISPEMIERIEIVKGPRSSIYGSSALGGVINIITRKGKKSLSASITSGTNETKKLALSAGFKTQGVDGIVSFEDFSTGGYLDKTASTKKHASKNQSLQFKVGKSFETFRLELSHLQNKGDVEYESFGSELAQENDNKVTKLSYSLNVSDSWDSIVSYSKAQDHISQVKNNDKAFTDRTALEWQNNIKLGINEITLGILSEQTKVDALSFGTTIDKETAETAVYLQDHIMFGASALILALRSTKEDVWGSNTTYNVDYGFDLSSDVKLTASIGTGFRAPTFTDQFGFGGNVNLKPETSVSKELGVKYTLDTNQKVAANYYINDIDNLIATKNNKNENIAKAKITGVDIRYSVKNKALNVNAGLVLQDPKDVSNNVVLSRRAERSVTLNAIYKVSDFTVASRLLAVGERDNSFFDTKVLAAYEVVHLNLKYAINKNMSVSTSIENLFDKQYETASGFPAKSRSVYLTFKYQQ